MSELPQFFLACCLWPLLGRPLAALQYVMYFRFCGKYGKLAAKHLWICGYFYSVVQVYTHIWANYRTAASCERCIYSVIYQALSV